MTKQTSAQTTEYYQNLSNENTLWPFLCYSYISFCLAPSLRFLYIWCRVDSSESIYTFKFNECLISELETIFVPNWEVKDHVLILQVQHRKVSRLITQNVSMILPDKYWCPVTVTVIHYFTRQNLAVSRVSQPCCVLQVKFLFKFPSMWYELK